MASPGVIFGFRLLRRGAGAAMNAGRRSLLDSRLRGNDGRGEMTAGGMTAGGMTDGGE